MFVIVELKGLIFIIELFFIFYARKVQFVYVFHQLLQSNIFIRCLLTNLLLFVSLDLLWPWGWWIYQKVKGCLENDKGCVGSGGLPQATKKNAFNKGWHLTPSPSLSYTFIYVVRLLERMTKP